MDLSFIGLLIKSQVYTSNCCKVLLMWVKMTKIYLSFLKKKKKNDLMGSILPNLFFFFLVAEGRGQGEPLAFQKFPLLLYFMNNIFKVFVNFT
jgi:hypothetical protein